jgi:hypothetical protein
MEREKMDAALKEHVIPMLRSLGFKGSVPHFRRNTGQQIDLLPFQFDRHGGAFVVEVAVCPIEGITTHWGKQIPPTKVAASNMHPNQRVRLGAPKGEDHWFRYDDKGDSATRFADTAREVLPHLSIQATEHWARGLR